jgi:hypothetical protein
MLLHPKIRGLDGTKEKGKENKRNKRKMKKWKMKQKRKETNKRGHTANTYLLQCEYVG